MITRFFSEEDGSQLIEYALVIASFSLLLALALQPGATEESIDVFLLKLTACLMGACA